jgi:hypothetical protein
MRGKISTRLIFKGKNRWFFPWGGFLNQTEPKGKIK